jgi:hypothetical protein
MLESEQKYFDEHKDELVEKYLDRFVLIKGEELVGVFNTVEEAISEGARRFGLSSFMVRQVSKEAEAEVYIPALSLGLLNANSTRSI